VPATEVFRYPDRYSFWINVKEPECYYIKHENNIELKYAK
jgi:hypothetical protein